jgi:hypothetical protein
MAALIVTVRDVSSGRIHRRFKIEGTDELAAFESDNSDQAGEFVIIDSEALSDTDPEAFCKRCFPELHE